MELRHYNKCFYLRALSLTSMENSGKLFFSPLISLSFFKDNFSNFFSNNSPLPTFPCSFSAQIKEHLNSAAALSGGDRIIIE